MTEVKQQEELPEPISSSPELSLKEIQEKADHYWALIDKAKDYKEYEDSWNNYDMYMDLKRNYKK